MTERQQTEAFLKRRRESEKEIWFCVDAKTKANLRVWLVEGIKVFMRGDVYKQSSFPFTKEHLYYFGECGSKLEKLAELADANATIDEILDEIERLNLKEVDQDKFRW